MSSASTWVFCCCPPEVGAHCAKTALTLICLMQFAMAVTYCMLYLETVERSTQDAGVYLMLLGIAFCKVCLLLLPALVLFHMGLKSGSISNISYSLDLQILWLTIQAIEILVGHALHTKWELTIAEAAAFVILSYFTLVTYCFWKAQRANQMSPDLSDREGTDESSVVEAFASREQFVPQRSVSGIQQISPRA